MFCGPFQEVLVPDSKLWIVSDILNLMLKEGIDLALINYL